MGHPAPMQRGGRRAPCARLVGTEAGAHSTTPSRRLSLSLSHTHIHILAHMVSSGTPVFLFLVVNMYTLYIRAEGAPWLANSSSSIRGGLRGAEVPPEAAEDPAEVPPMTSIFAAAAASTESEYAAVAAAASSDSNKRTRQAYGDADDESKRAKTEGGGDGNEAQAEDDEGADPLPCQPPTQGPPAFSPHGSAFPEGQVCRKACVLRPKPSERP